MSSNNVIPSPSASRERVSQQLNSKSPVVSEESSSNNNQGSTTPSATTSTNNKVADAERIAAKLAKRQAEIEALLAARKSQPKQ